MVGIFHGELLVITRWYHFRCPLRSSLQSLEFTQFSLSVISTNSWWTKMSVCDPESQNMRVIIWQITCYPLVNSHIPMERSTIFHGKIQYKWWCSIVMLNYQRVTCYNIGNSKYWIWNLDNDLTLKIFNIKTINWNGFRKMLLNRCNIRFLDLVLAIHPSYPSHYESRPWA